MNISIPKRFIIINTSVYIVFFGLLVVFSYFLFEPKSIDIYFRNDWVINNTIILFFDFLIPAQCLSLLLTFSLFIPKDMQYSTSRETKRKELNTNITIVICIILVLTAFFLAGNEIIKPRSHSKIKTIQYASQTARTYLNQAKEETKKGDFLYADELISKYLTLKPKDKEGLEVEAEIQTRISNQKALLSDKKELEKKKVKPLNLTGQEAINIAKDYLKEEDYFSAYYYAQIALNISGANEDAKIVSTKAWNYLSKIEPSKQEIEEYRLFYQKKKGTELLVSGKSIEAYYLFKKLNAEYPHDNDVKKYLNESIKKTLELAFFINEAKNALFFPGISDICFLNKNNDSEVEVCFIGKMVTVDGGTFFKDVETISIGRNGGIKNHLSAPYGKLVDNHIIVKGIDEENQDIETSAEYYVKDFHPELSNAIKININAHLLAGLSTDENIYKTLSLLQLFEFKPLIADFGWPAEPVYIEILNRILGPCNFIILSLFIIILSWKYRRDTTQLPILGVIFIPVIFFILLALTNAYQYGIKLLSSWLYLNFNSMIAIGLLATSQIILLVVSFLLLASINVGRVNDN